MIDLRPCEHAALSRLVAAGKCGLVISQVGLSAALRLQLAGFVTIHAGPGPQRVTVTHQGAAHARRQVFA